MEDDRLKLYLEFCNKVREMEEENQINYNGYQPGFQPSQVAVDKQMANNAMLNSHGARF